MVNYYGMYRSLENYLRHYEQGKSGAGSPHEQMLHILEAPYNDLRNRDDFLAALKEAVTEEEAQLWCLCPDFTYDPNLAKSTEEIACTVPEHLRARVQELLDRLTEKLFLYQLTTEAGVPCYCRTYLFFLVYEKIFAPDDSALTKVCLQWWEDVRKGDSAQLRAENTEYRVLPHEGVLKGKQEYGRISMKMEIPDTRMVLDMDLASEILRKQRSITAIDCMCRTAQDDLGQRQCDAPKEGVCILFNQAADGLIEAGYGPALTVEEAEKILRRCRDAGLVQTVSNAEHPLSLCNCCACCCICLQSMQRYEDVVCKGSRYLADGAAETCVGCGACAKVCPMDAIEMKDGRAGVRSRDCIGCGLCVSRCPAGALRLGKRPGAADKPERERCERMYI